MPLPFNVRLADLLIYSANANAKCVYFLSVFSVKTRVTWCCCKHCCAVPGGKPNHLIRHTSCDSVDSINSQSSTGSLASQQSALTYSDKKKLKKKNWVCF